MPLYLKDKLVSGTGAQGKSAYQTAAEAGYMGTEAAFNSALRDVPAHIADSDVHVTVAQKSEWDNKAESIHAARHAAGGADPITPASIGADPSGSAAAVQSNLDGHTVNSAAHITEADRTKWDGKQDKLTFDATPTANSTNPVTSGGVKTELDKKADAPKSVSVTLAAASWDSTAKTQTVTVTGVSATETAQMITPTPALASQTAYYDAGILCTGQAAGSLTFTANTIPTADLTVYVVIQEVAQG